MFFFALAAHAALAAPSAQEAAPQSPAEEPAAAPQAAPSATQQEPSAEAASPSPDLSDTEIWNLGVDAFRAHDATNAVRLLRPLMASKEYGARAAEIIASLAYDSSRSEAGSGSALASLEEAAYAAQKALYAAPEDARARRNFARAVASLPELRETKRINDILEKTKNSDKGAMMLAGRDDARALLAESTTYRTNNAATAVAKADALSARASRLADMWIPLKELIAQSITNEAEAAGTIMQTETARERCLAAARALGDMEDGAFEALADAEHDFSRFHKLVAMPDAALAQDAIAQSNAWQDVETVNGNDWQKDALDYTRAFRQKFPMWAQQYERQAAADTNMPPFTAEQQAQISSLSTQLEKLQLECVQEILPPKQEEAMEIIRQIAELMPKNKGGSQSGQSGQPQGGESNPQQDPRQGQDKPDGGDDKSQEDLGRAPEQQPEQKEEPAAKDSGDGKKSPEDEEIEAMLKKAQERTDEHEEEKKRRMRRAVLPPNERDW